MVGTKTIDTRFPHNQIEPKWQKRWEKEGLYAIEDDGKREIKPIMGLEVEISRREVKLDGQPLDLTTMEYELLVLFMQFPNKTFSRDELMNRLRGIDAELFSRAVDTLVSRLRNKLKDTSKTPRFIKTIWGRGYTFVGEQI